MGGASGRSTKILGRKALSDSELEALMIVWVILAVIFVVLLFAYVRVRGRRLSR
jgi:hypothetical protein